MKRLFACLLLLAALFVSPTVSAQKVSESGAASARSRRVLYNFDGDSCMTRKAGTKQPERITVDDIKRFIKAVAYEASRVDTVLICINAQVMYYPTRVGTIRGMYSTPLERARWPASEKQRFLNMRPSLTLVLPPMRSCWRKRSGVEKRRYSRSV